MKIIKINDNLKINIEQIYSLEKNSNQIDIDDWEREYSNMIKEYSKDPPMLVIDSENVFKPNYGEENDTEKLKKYMDALNTHIINILGDKPKYVESYKIILSTGLKVNISKYIYDIINNYLEQYIINQKKEG